MFMMPKPQLQQAVAMVILSNTTIIPARQCSTKQTASKLATSGIYLSYLLSAAAGGGRRDGRKHHGRAHEPAWPSRATRATRANGIRRRANLISYLISYLIIICVRSHSGTVCLPFSFLARALLLPGTMSVYYWPPTTIERQQANAKERAASNWENGGRQLARCNAPAQMQMRARLRHQLQAMEDPDSWDAVSLKGILSMAEWKASVFAAEAETDAVQWGNGGGAKAADASSFRERNKRGFVVSCLQSRAETSSDRTTALRSSLSTSTSLVTVPRSAPPGPCRRRRGWHLS